MTTMVRDSVENLTFTLADRDGKDLSADTVQLSLALRGAAPSTWLACTHVTGTTWRTSSPITWSAVNYPASSYLAYAKVADAPETPLAQIGLVNIR